MKIEIINKPMLCWNNDETSAKEYHVLAKVTECDSKYAYKAMSNENTYPHNPTVSGVVEGFLNAKPLLETIELTITEINKLLGKNVKIVDK